MARAWRIDRFGLEALQCVEVPLVEPGPGEVRLRMQAVSLNYRDLLMVRGHYDPRVPLPLVPCSDGVGVVEAVGTGVDLPIGHRCMPIFAEGWLAGPPLASHLKTTRGGPLPGTLQSHLVLPAAATVPAGDLDDASAACIPCASVTAWHALEAAGVGSGSTVLVLGTGGVSTAALQLAHLRGARVAVTSSSADRLAACEAMGAELLVDYTEDTAWGRTVARWAGEGVDCVIEVGGAGTMAQSLRATRVGGTIALIGVLAGAAGDVPLVNALMRSIRIQGIFVGSREHHQAVTTALLDAPSAASPRVAHHLGWEEVPQAFEQLARGGHHGKIVVSI